MENTFHSTIAAQFTEAPDFSLNSMTKIKPPTPTKSMSLFEQELQGIDKQMDAKTQLKAINGWLSPDGQLFPCKWRQHSELGISLGFNGEAEMELKGWAKLTQMKWLIKGRYKKIELTDKQITTVNQWHDSNELNRDFYEFQQKN